MKKFRSTSSDIGWGDVFEAGLVDFGSFVFCEPLPRFL